MKPLTIAAMALAAAASAAGSDLPEIKVRGVLRAIDVLGRKP